MPVDVIDTDKADEILFVARAGGGAIAGKTTVTLASVFDWKVIFPLFAFPSILVFIVVRVTALVVGTTVDAGVTPAIDTPVIDIVPAQAVRLTVPPKFCVLVDVILPVDNSAVPAVAATFVA